MFEDFCNGPEGGQAESGANPRFGSSADEEFDIGDLVHIAGEYRQEGRGWLLVFALIEGIDDDQGCGVSGFEWANDQPLHLGTEGSSSGIGVGLQDSKQLLSERAIPMCELEGKGGEDGLEIVPIVEIARTEETSSELSVCEAYFRKRLGNSGLPGSGEAVEPEDVFILFVVYPAFELGKNVSSGPPHAPLSVNADVFRVGGVRHPVQTGEGRALLQSHGYYTRKGDGGGDSR